MYEDDFKNLKKLVLDVLPEDANISKIEFLGPEIYIYSKNIKLFYETDKFVSELAFKLKKRVNIRADSSILMNAEDAKKVILELISDDAKISAIYFDEHLSEVVIEAFKPGLVIGKKGVITKEIINTTRWTPNIIRAPSSECKALSQMRSTIYKNSKERKKNLTEVAKQIYSDRRSKKDWIRVTALGGFREVGRSCTLVETANSRVLIDCGVNVANVEEPFPMLETLGFDLNDLNAIILTHAHMDHCGFIPYLYRMGFTGPIYCTAPTRDIMYVMQFDYLNVVQKEGKGAPYGESDIREALKHVITRDYGEVSDITNDMRLTLHNASHILGSATVHLHINDGAHNIMFTGDLKYGFTRLFNKLEIDYPRLETLVIESTYGGRNDILPQRNIAEERLINTINETIKKGGNVLIPVFAVGRSQEVMLVLEEYFKRHRLLAKNIYLDGMIKDICSIHTVYPEYLRTNIQRRILQNNSPFDSPLFKEVNGRAERSDIIADTGNIILATSGMLTGGPSQEYFSKMVEDPKNTLIFVGYQGEGSLGRKLENGIKELTLTAADGKLRSVKVKMEIVDIEGFSGHSDRNQLLHYIKSLSPTPKKIILGHGEKEKSINFAKFINSKLKLNAVCPKILESIRLR
jgi:uncharacterized protein